MSEPAQATHCQGDVETMRRLVLEWLRQDGRDAASGGDTPEAQSEPKAEAVVQSFLLRASAAGFACEIAEVSESESGVPGYEARWTHQGASFVGFKQPPSQETPETALLAGCAALLGNDWCRSRLR